MPVLIQTVASHNEDSGAPVISKRYSIDAAEVTVASPPRKATAKKPPVAPQESPVPKRRHLPVETKQKVFNEWGAVMRH